MKKINISRRSFLFGGTGVLAGLGLSNLTGCQGAGDMATTIADSGNLVACSGYSSSFIQPMPVLDILSCSVSWHLYEGLYQLDRATGEIYNGIASDDPEKVDDLAYEISLNADKRFSDGSVVTAVVVNAVIGAYMNHNIYGVIFGFIKSLSVIDTYRLRINLKYPTDKDLLKRRLCTALIFKQGSLSNGDDESYIGTGSYVLNDASGENGQTVIFNPSSQYVGPKPPRAQLMSFNVAVNDDARVKQLVDGKSGLIEDVPYREVENLEAKGFKIDMQDSYSMPMLVFNTSHAPFNDVRIRKAILYAINEEKIIADILHGNGYVPESYLPKFDNTFHACKNVYKYDRQKAKDLISQAGRPNLYFTLHASPNACVENFVEEIKQNLSDVGITCNVKVEAINWSQFLDPEYKDDYDACLAPIDPSVMGNDTDLMISAYYGETAVQKHITYFSDSDPDSYDQLQNILQEARTSTGDKQIEAWNNAQEIIADKVPMYPILHRKIVTAYNSKIIRGYEGNISSGLYMLDTAPIR